MKMELFFLSFEAPGYHFGTLGPYQNDVPALQNSMKVNPQTDLTAARWRGWANGQMDRLDPIGSQFHSIGAKIDPA